MASQGGLPHNALAVTINNRLSTRRRLLFLYPASMPKLGPSLGVPEDV